MGAVIFGGLFGFVVFRARLKRSKAKIHDLEMELMRSNEETLEAQRAFVILESKVKDQQPIPVISMKINGKENKEKVSK
ncbi:MAG TPA: hypothetical protein VN616_02900 [Puia sp.]|nr:hypothetical protein [Puia sp.]